MKKKSTKPTASKQPTPPPVDSAVLQQLAGAAGGQAPSKPTKKGKDFNFER